jgi:hypothetical protein
MSQTVANAGAAALINNFANPSIGAVDVVGIFDQNYNQIVPNVRPIRATVKEDAEFPKHPLETGASIQDHRIFNPIEIELSVVFNSQTFVDDYATLETAYNATNALNVLTKTRTYGNMFIKSLPHVEDADTFDTIRMVITLTEVVVVQSQTQALPQNASDGATVNRGAQQGTTQTAPSTVNGNTNTGSAAYNFFYGAKQ